MEVIIISILQFIGISTIATSVITTLIGLYLKKQFDKMEHRGESRIKENMVTMKYLKSLGALTYATGIAVKEGKVNGEMTAAMAEFKECNSELDDFILESNARERERNN